jgi:exosortase A
MTADLSPKLAENEAGKPCADAWGCDGFWLLAIALCGVLGWCVAWYWHTAVDVASIWWRSETFAHGLIVFPVFAWLVWRKRTEIGGLIPRPVPWMAIPTAGAGALWLLGQMVSVAAAVHAGLILMVILGMIGTIGWRLARVLLFPLAFLLFGIPIGEFLLPTLMNLTAQFTVFAVRASGVPVYQEGLHFVVPNGRWSVVEACSGIRYLIASLLVGSLYAYLNYVSLRKRLLFMLVAILVPIVANWLRAYMIVMLGYLSGNELATGVDHLIYGWVFFGVVIMVMFWIGQRWSDEPITAPQSRTAPLDHAAANWMGVLPIAVTIAFFSVVNAYFDKPVTPFEVHYSLPAPAEGWLEDRADALPYRPHYLGYRGESVKAYRDAQNGQVVLYSALFESQQEGAEMVTWGNGLIGPDTTMLNLVSAGSFETTLGTVRGARIIGSGMELAVLEWYLIDGRVVTRDWEVKLRLATKRLLGQSDASMVFVLASPNTEEGEGFRRLRAFLDTHGRALELAAQQAMNMGAR